jgi:hypothetical protein
MNYKNIIYSLACLSFSIVIGAGMYEHVAAVPRWSAAPPSSLTMFQGQYGLYPEPFWIGVHPIALVLLIITLILAWKTSRRINVIATIVGYIAVLAITRVYFVPELLDIINTPVSANADTALTERAKQWEMLSLARMAFMMILSIILFLGLTKGNDRGYRS